MWLLVALAHMQSVAPLLAPASLLLLAALLVVRGDLSSSAPARLLLIVYLAAYLVLLVVVNEAWSNLGVVEYVSRYARVFYLLGFLLLAFGIRPGRGHERAFLRSYVVAAAGIGLLSLVSLFGSPIVVGEVPFSGDGLPFGPFGGRNPLAGMLGAAGVVALVAWLRVSDGWRSWTKVTSAAGGVVVAVLIVSQSRGYALGFAAAGATALILSGLREHRRGNLRPATVAAWLAAPVVAGLVLVSLADRLSGLGQDQNVVTRLDLWARATRMVAESPLFGLGMGAFESRALAVRQVVPGLVQQRTGGYYADTVIEHNADGGGLHAHNVVLQMLVDTGFVGTLAFALLIVAGWRGATMMRQSADDDARAAAAVLQLSVVYLLVAGLTAGYTFTSPTTAMVLYFVLGRVLRASWTGEATRGGGQEAGRPEAASDAAATAPMAPSVAR